MAEDSDLERTEAPSERRLEEARARGQVPASRELAAFMVLAGGVAGMLVMGDWLAARAAGILRRGLQFGAREAFESQAMAAGFVTLAGEGLMLAAPLFLLCLAGSLATPFLLKAWVFSPKALQLDFSRLDPLRGLGRMFSLSGAGELVKAMLKSLLVAGIVYFLVREKQEAIFALALLPVETGLAAFARLLLFCALLLVAGVALIAAMDVPFQLWQYYRKLRMTKEELRQELKENEGDPQLKGRIRSQQREIASRRMMSEVPKADVIVTNPTHYAVALSYQAPSMAAPRVVAKGADHIAEKIREVAREAGVPLLEAPPLARALYRHTRVGDEIPPALYSAVAEVMAYVYQLDRYLTGGGGEQPAPPAALSLPPGMEGMAGA